MKIFAYCLVVLSILGLIIYGFDSPAFGVPVVIAGLIFAVEVSDRYELKKMKQRVEQERIDSTPERVAEYRSRPLKEVTDHHLNLRKGEACYLSMFATLHGYKRTRGVVAYHGPILRIPIAKGLTYRAALLAGAGATSEEIVQLAIGRLYVTNKRVIFRGDKKNNSASFNQIIETTYYQGDDALRIDKGNGPPIILYPFNGVLAWVVMDKILNGEYD